MKKVVLLILFLGISYHLFAQTITRAEYFINNDPGYGLGETIPILSQTSLDLVLPLDTLSSGLHTFYVRVLKDDNLNEDCAHEERKSLFENSSCPGIF